MEQNSTHNDLKHIRTMMEQSSRFISLSGLAGVFAGNFGLIAAYIAYNILGVYHVEKYDVPSPDDEDLFMKLLWLGAITLFLSLASGIGITLWKSKNKQLPIWTQATKKLLITLFVPLLAGGLVCLAFLYHNDLYYIAPATLVFYGIALINSSKFTFGDVYYLGICEIILGIIAFYFLGYGLLFWTIGFGFLHIIYGVIMWIKYK